MRTHTDKVDELVTGKNTILNRVGSKRRIADKIQKYFPKHQHYVEMFFGAGGMFFNKPMALYNTLNDLDNDVYNLFNVIRNDKDKLVETLIRTPIHQSLFNEWRKTPEQDPIWQAVRFLILSNCSLYGKMGGLRFQKGNQKKMIIERIDKTFLMIQNVYFMNCDFRKVIPLMSFCCECNKKSTFIYADPPYLGTTNNYNTPKWTKDDVKNLIDICKTTDCKMAISEFDNPIILEMAKGLNVYNIGERLNLKNRREEILITNYEHEEKLIINYEEKKASGLFYEKI